MSERELDLGKAELEVLRALWDHGPGTVREVLNHLTDAGRDLAYTTVQTMLTRLEQKEFVQSDKSGAAFVYRASVSRKRVSKSRLRELLDQLYDGAAGPLVLQLVKSQRLKRDELEELRKLIDDLSPDEEC